MAIFNNMAITTKGQALYAKAQAGIQLNFTKLQIGSGTIGTQNPATLVALINAKFDVGIQSITPNTELKTATIAGMINNSNVVDATYICEIGIFAQDPDEGEILYGYGSAGIYGDYMAPASQGAYSWNYEINAAVGNAANVTVQLSNLTYDYGMLNTNTTFAVLSGGNQKEINKSIDTHLLDMDYQVATGTATAITLTMQTLRNGYAKTFIASANNSGALTTINTKKLYKPGTTTSPTLIAGKAYTVWYNAAGDCFFIKASAEGDADISHVLATKKFSNDNDTGLVGTMPNKGAVTITPSTTNQTIPLGYHNGSGIVTGDADLVTGNIKAGANIFGIAGKSSVVDTADATATAAQIIAGYTAYKNGSKITGTASITSLGGRRFISANNVILSKSIISFTDTYGSTGNQQVLNITGFDFIPSCAIVLCHNKNGTMLPGTGYAADTAILGSYSYFKSNNVNIIASNGRLQLPVNDTGSFSDNIYSYFVYE